MIDYQYFKIVSSLNLQKNCSEQAFTSTNEHDHLHSGTQKEHKRQTWRKDQYLTSSFSTWINSYMFGIHFMLWQRTNTAKVWWEVGQIWFSTFKWTQFQGTISSPVYCSEYMLHYITEFVKSVSLSNSKRASIVDSRNL